MIKSIRSIRIVNRVIASILKFTGIKLIWSRWPLKGTVKVKISDARIAFYSNCDDYLLSNLYYRGTNEEIREISHLLTLLSPRSKGIFLDVGSYNGLFALVLSKKFPDSTIIAFEPNPVNCERILKNLALNNPANFKVYNIGISDKEDTLSFYIQANSQITTVSSFNQSFTENHSLGKLEEIQVKTHSLDDFCRNKCIQPDFIKIDVEGHELPVLNGAKRILEKYKPLILCEIFTRRFNSLKEYQRASNKIWQIEVLFKRLGYHIYILENTRLLEIESLNYNNSNRNYFFIHGDTNIDFTHV